MKKASTQQINTFNDGSCINSIHNNNPFHENIVDDDNNNDDDFLFAIVLNIWRDSTATTKHIDVAAIRRFYLMYPLSRYRFEYDGYV